MAFGHDNWIKNVILEKVSGSKFFFNLKQKNRKSLMIIIKSQIQQYSTTMGVHCDVDEQQAICVFQINLKIASDY